MGVERLGYLGGPTIWGARVSGGPDYLGGPTKNVSLKRPI